LKRQQARASSMPAKSGTAPVPTRPATACDARSAFTWSRIMRNLAIGPAATSIAATSVLAIHRSTKAFSPSCGQKRGIGHSGSSTIAKVGNAFQFRNQDRCMRNGPSRVSGPRVAEIRFIKDRLGPDETIACHGAGVRFNHTNAWLTDPIGTGEDKA
jgi:hypothetical protein